uniref:DNA-binding protein n=1 Tax=Streptococcus pluranimalium TaxID=82348 RepID=UPI003F692275
MDSDIYKNKQHLSQLFDVPLKTLNNDLTEMRKLSRFQDFIIKPSHKRVYISVEGYRQYLKYKQSKREKAM